MEQVIKMWKTAVSGILAMGMVALVLAFLVGAERAEAQAAKPDVMQTTLALLGACNVNLELTRQQALTWERVKMEIEAMNPKTTFDIETKRITPKP